MVQVPNKFGSLNIEELLLFESDNDLKLPEDYRQFLIQFNGGRPIGNSIKTEKLDTDVRWLFGIHHGPEWASLLSNIDTYANRIPSWYFPIGTDSGGNLFLMSLYKNNFGVIAFWDHEKEAKEGMADQYFDNLTWVANSFTEFISCLRLG